MKDSKADTSGRIIDRKTGEMYSFSSLENLRQIILSLDLKKEYSGDIEFVNQTYVYDSVDRAALLECIDQFESKIKESLF